MALIYSAWSYPSSGATGLGDSYDISYDSSNGGFASGDNTNTWGEWSYAGSSFERGQTTLVSGFDLTPTSAYGVAAVTQINIDIERMLTTQSGDSYLVMCPTTSAWAYQGGDEWNAEMSWSSGSTTKAFTTHTDDHWGLTHAMMENIFNGVSGWGIRLRWDFGGGGTARDARVYRVRMRFWEDTAYEPPISAGGIHLGGSF
jgi:hypothetical protein